ncbi:MAG: hypothetical protein V4760_02405 [Bdellovibrionota bacterium]
MRSSKLVYRILTVLVLAWCFAPSARASVALGTGFSSTTSGRQIPTIAGAVDVSSWTVSGFATGVATTVYSQSGYLLSVTTNFVKGSFLGEFEAKAGGGVYYSKRTLRDSPTATLQAEDSFAAGPSFRSIWRPFSPMYLGFDVLVGVRPSTAHIGIAIQDVVSMSIGFEL